MSEMALRKISGADWQGEILAKYDLPSIREALAQIKQLTLSPEARLLMEGRNRLVVLDLPLSPPETMEVVVKEFRPRGLVKLRSLVTGSKARRSFYGALKLRQREINTPEPVAYIESCRLFSTQTEYFLAARIRETQEIRFFFQTYPEEQIDSLLHQLAAFVRQINERGVWHRDLSDGNVLVKTVRDNFYEFYLLDPNRIRIKRQVGRWLGLKSLIRLGVPASKQRFFIKAYLNEGKNFFPYWLWYRLNKRLFTSWIKIKKWLRLRALARRLKLQ